MSSVKEILRAVSTELETKAVAEQTAARACLSVLNDIVRPTLREAEEEMRSNGRIAFDVNSREPFIVVTSDREKPDSLHFLCNAGSLEMRQTVKGIYGQTDTALMHNVSPELIADVIARFLRHSLS